MKNFIVLDTETANSLDDPIAYDIGWAVVAENGDVLETRSFVVEEVFMNLEMMASAYFADKRSLYWDGIEDGSRIMTSLYNIRNTLYKDCKKYDVLFICAHNARFDALSTRTTLRYLTKSKRRFFLPYGVELWDTLKMAKDAFSDDEEYSTFCEENGYKTKNGQKRFTAEILYRFLTGNNDFEESHTGLEDVLIEKEIYFACVAKGVTNGKLY